MTETKIDSRPILGDINERRRGSVEQKSAAEFIAVVDKLLALPGVGKLAWKQYTPYFNDGDPCEFGVHGVAFQFLDGFLPTPPDEDDLDNFYAVEGAWFTVYDMYTYGPGGYTDRIFTEYGVDLEPYYKALADFEGQLGAFEYVLQDNFGDHAVVTATVHGFNVEGYEHD